MWTLQFLTTITQICLQRFYVIFQLHHFYWNPHQQKFSSKGIGASNQLGTMTKIPAHSNMWVLVRIMSVVFPTFEFVNVDVISIWKTHVFFAAGKELLLSRSFLVFYTLPSKSFLTKLVARDEWSPAASKNCFTCSCQVPWNSINPFIVFHCMLTFLPRFLIWPCLSSRCEYFSTAVCYWKVSNWLVHNRDLYHDRISVYLLLQQKMFYVCWRRRYDRYASLR